jgi:hypothetical protein
MTWSGRTAPVILSSLARPALERWLEGVEGDSPGSRRRARSQSSTTGDGALSIAHNEPRSLVVGRAGAVDVVMIMWSLCQAEPDVFCHVRDLG